MTVVRRDDEAGEKIIAVSRVVYERVVGVHPNPSKPTEHPHIPVPDEPTPYSDGGIGATILAVLALTLIGGFAFFLLLRNARQRPSERQLFPQWWLPPPAPAPPFDIPLADPDCSAPPPYDDHMTADSEINSPLPPHPPITRSATPPLFWGS
ncbi:hypothetical protein M407DRAFT_158573 [Tulasnella calospora MUT 4182]|uniref:Uncharacterized protein n=1 Tax=Tulasnella calospora MUT 4182 TaxID=1051891 RepID=A0A0C3L8K1_9AGAM|nr:hypothetical protein M407DRAFT_158573 [Tulasnella calospora MUT 4182]